MISPKLFLFLPFFHIFFCFSYSHVVYYTHTHTVNSRNVRMFSSASSSCLLSILTLWLSFCWFSLFFHWRTQHNGWRCAAALLHDHFHDKLQFPLNLFLFLSRRKGILHTQLFRRWETEEHFMAPNDSVIKLSTPKSVSSSPRLTEFLTIFWRK
jgi:hypothetical protein